MGLLNNLIKGKVFQTRTGTGFLRTIGNIVGDTVTKPLLGPLKFINNIFRRRALVKAGRLSTIKTMSKVARKQRWSRSGIIKRAGVALKKAAAWLPAMGILALGKKVLGGGKGSSGDDNPGKSLSSEFTPPNPVEPITQNTDRSGTATEESIKAQRDSTKSQLDIKIAEAKASKMAADRLTADITTTHSKLPDKLSEIYTRSNNTNDQLDAIIKLLNQQNEVSNESRKNTYATAKNIEADLRSRSTRESELYASLIALRTKQDSANQDAIKAIRKSGDKVSAQISKSRDDLKSYKAESKKSSLAKWLLFGGISLGVYQLIKGLGGIGNTLSAGFNFIKDGLSWIGEKLGFIHVDMATIAGEQMAAEANDPKLESTKSDSLDANGDSVVTQEDFTDPETKEVDKESATKAGVNTTYKAQNVGNYMAGAMATGSLFDLGKVISKVRKGNKAAKLASEEALSKGFTASARKLAADKAFKEAVGYTDEISSKKGLWSRFTSKVKSRITKVSKLVADSSIGKVVIKSFKSVTDKTWKGVAKIIGPKAVKVLQTFSKSVAVYSSKLAKAGAKKIPGVGLIFGLIDAIYRGFKEGDWTGALISALAGIASTFPGLGTAVSIALDGLQISRDIYKEKQAERDSIEVNKILAQLQRDNLYKPGQRGNLFNEVIRKLGGTNDRLSEELKNKIIKKLKNVYDNKNYNNWSDLRRLTELNNALSGSGISYNLLTKKLEGLKSYSTGTKFHPGGEAIVGDGNKSELIITPDNQAYVTPDKPTLVDIPKGSKVIPEVKELKGSKRKVRAYAKGTEYENYVELNPKVLTPISNLSARDQRIIYSMNYLVDKMKLEPEVAAGLVGNMLAESNLNPASINKSEKYGTATSKGIKYRPTGYGAGIIQWTNTSSTDKRKDDILNYINSKFKKSYRGVEEASLPEQLDAVVHEFKSRPSNFNKFKNSRSIESSVDVALRGYINGSKSALASKSAMNAYTWADGYVGLMNTRTKNALEAYNMYTGKSIKIEDLNPEYLKGGTFTESSMIGMSSEFNRDDSTISGSSDNLTDDVKGFLSKIFTGSDTYSSKPSFSAPTDNMSVMDTVVNEPENKLSESKFETMMDKYASKFEPKVFNTTNSGGNVVNNNTTHIHIQSNNALDNELN